jgi:acetyl-CoA carboxylase biotin carboxyl carrier protein
MRRGGVNPNAIRVPARILVDFNALPARPGLWYDPCGPMATPITAHITGTVWKIEKRCGDTVSTGEAVVILESMKMEMPVESPVSGTLTEMRCAEGDAVEEGTVLAVVE